MNDQRAPEVGARPLRVLVADDNRVNLLLASAVLRKLGHQIEAVGNGAEVMQALARTRYDVILMDGQMPEMDGFEAAAAIRAREAAGQAGRVWIIAVTGETGEEGREKARRAGMDDHLGKPLQVEALRAALARAGRTKTGGEDDEILDPAVLDELRALRNHHGTDSLRELAAIFAADAPPLFQRLNEAASSGDLAAAAAHGHALRGSAGLFGAMQLVGLLQTFEKSIRAGALEGINRQVAGIGAALDLVLKRLREASPGE